jgi:hypothetical protein
MEMVDVGNHAINSKINHGDGRRHNIGKSMEMVDVAGESRERITIVVEIVVGTNFTRIMLLAATMQKTPKSI